MIALSATNPCHLYDLAVALHRLGALSAYHSGYPAWKLRPPSGFPIKAHSYRTLATYGLLRLPHAIRPNDDALFRWQDDGFDLAVAASLEAKGTETIHALPGQALATFKRAKDLGMSTVLNHASGPVRRQFAVINEQRERIGLAPRSPSPSQLKFFARVDAEHTHADFHCVASTLVKDQLVQTGIPLDKIAVVPYAANPVIFHPPQPGDLPRKKIIIFAGQLTLRKGISSLLEAFSLLRTQQPEAELHLYGRPDAEMAVKAQTWSRLPGVKLHGPVAQRVLAESFRRASVLALPSWEEAFGLVVPQALACSLPCVVSDRVGAKDLIMESANGSVFPAGDAQNLAVCLSHWLTISHPVLRAPYSWDEAAARLIDITRTQLNRCN